MNTVTNVYFLFLQDYHKALEDEDEKVQLTAQIYDLVLNFAVNITGVFHWTVLLVVKVLLRAGCTVYRVVYGFPA